MLTAIRIYQLQNFLLVLNIFGIKRLKKVSFAERRAANLGLDTITHNAMFWGRRASEELFVGIQTDRQTDRQTPYLSTIKIKVQ